MAGARWPIGGALGAAAVSALLWGCPDANPLVVGTGGMSSTSSSSSSSTGTSTETSTTTTSSSSTGTGGSAICPAAKLLSAGVDYPTGTFLGGIATGDMDGDGKPDLVVSTSGTPQQVVVVLNKGKGVFMPYSYTIAEGPTAVAVADLDGDSKLDVAATVGSGVAIFLGNGAGSLNAQNTVPVSAGATAVAAADLNGDGNPDLAVANAAASVLLNSGQGMFLDPSSYPELSACVSVAVADLDGNGKPDLALACEPVSASDTGHVYVILNLGGGNFATPVDYPAGITPSSIVAVDLTGDGKPDIAVADSANGAIRVLINQGTVFATPVSYPAGDGPLVMAAGDVNGDGLTDLVVANSLVSQVPDAGIPMQVGVLLNNGQGTFVAPIQFPLGSAASGLVATDLNGDGKIDVAVARVDGNVTVLLNGCP